MTPDRLSAAMEATWPPVETLGFGPVTLRRGGGGGKRVAAASVLEGWRPADLEAAERRMADWGQSPLFVLGPGAEALDAALAARGHALIDPVVIFAAPVARLNGADVGALRAFSHWPPLQIARDLWAEARVTDARVAVMERVSGGKTVLLGRHSDRAAGCAFVACDGDVAMLHALEVAPQFRRNGLGRDLLLAAAAWAAAEGAQHLALAVTEANGPARALYTQAGMDIVGRYHYRGTSRGVGWNG